LEELGSTRKH
jgi:hypothetical protein